MNLEQQLAPMLAVLRERMTAGDLPPLREGPGWLVYQNEDGERLCANNVVVASPMIELDLLVRVQPENVVAQTGLMQGAAGVGLAMLHLDGALTQRKPFVILPDSP